MIRQNGRTGHGWRTVRKRAAARRQKGKRMDSGRKRQANFELLRILAMLMVVVMHFLSHTGALPAAQEGRMPGEREIFGTFLEAFCIVAVNVYVLLSGFFLSEKDFSFRRLWRLLLQILFYTLLIPPVLALAGALSWQEVLDPYHIWNCLFPVQSGHYWFVTAYVVMLLFSPVLNAAVRTLSRRQLKAVILGLLVFFCFGKSLSVLPFGTDRYGYDFGWFSCLYLIAAYLRKYGSTFLYGKKRGGALYLLSCTATAALALFCLYVCGRTGALEYYASVPFHYNFILCLAGALGLFSFFAGLRIPEGALSQAVRRISPAVFGVYLIHEHADVSARWALWIVGDVSEHFWGYLIQLTESVLLVFFVSVCIDLLRARMFDAAGRLLMRTKPGARFRGLLSGLDGMMRERKE